MTPRSAAYLLDRCCCVVEAKNGRDGFTRPTEVGAGASIYHEPERIRKHQHRFSQFLAVSLASERRPSGTPALSISL